MLYSSKTRQNFNHKICDLGEDPYQFYWLSAWATKCFCSLNFHKCKYCESDWCPRHGQFQRIEDRKRVGCDPGEDCAKWAIVVRWGVPLPCGICKEARKKISKDLSRLPCGCEHIWRWEWKHYLPHLNITSLVRASVSKSALVTTCWRTLAACGLSPGGGADVYCCPVRNWDKWHSYMFKCKNVLKDDECPPHVKGWRWSYWGMSEGFPRSEVVDNE